MTHEIVDPAIVLTFCLLLLKVAATSRNATASQCTLRMRHNAENILSVLKSGFRFLRFETPPLGLKNPDFIFQNIFSYACPCVD